MLMFACVQTCNRLLDYVSLHLSFAYKVAAPSHNSVRPAEAAIKSTKKSSTIAEEVSPLMTKE